MRHGSGQMKPVGGLFGGRRFAEKHKEFKPPVASSGGEVIFPWALVRKWWSYIWRWWLQLRLCFRLLRHEAQADAIDAVSLPGGCGSVAEDVPEMRAAPRAAHLAAAQVA